MGLSEDYPQHYAEWWATGGNHYSEIPFELHLADLNIRPISDKRRWELLYYIASNLVEAADHLRAIPLA